jgi:uncharacterized protein YciI
MSASAEEQVRQLTRGMLRKKLYVILSKGGATPDQISAALPEHLEYMIELEKKGALFASGPLTAAAGQPAGDGLTILRAASVDEARAIASAGPFVVKKLRSFEVREWTVMEGSLGLKVNFSDQTLEIA